MPAPPDLGVTLGQLAGRCDATVETLLLALPSAGDGIAQDALDGYLDAVMDLLRMVAAAARDGAALLPPPAVAQAPAASAPVRGLP